MATPFDLASLLGEQLTLDPQEVIRLEKRRTAVREYEPPKWTSTQMDPVSGQYTEYPMVEHASILHAYYIC